MVILVALMALLALFAGTLAFVTGPVGLVVAAFVAAWLLGYAARSLKSGRKAAHHD